MAYFIVTPVTTQCYKLSRRPMVRFKVCNSWSYFLVLTAWMNFKKLQNLDGDEFHRKHQNLFHIKRIRKQRVSESEEMNIFCFNRYLKREVFRCGSISCFQVVTNCVTFSDPQSHSLHCTGLVWSFLVQYWSVQSSLEHPNLNVADGRIGYLWPP